MKKFLKWSVIVAIALGVFSAIIQEWGFWGILITAGVAYLIFYIKRKQQKEKAYRNAPLPAAPVQAPIAQSKYDFHHYKVVGVTFKNDDGARRQTLLRRFKWRDEPFDKSVTVGLSEYEFEGQPAIAVKANDIQLGNIGKDDISFLVNNWDRIDAVTALDVYGGDEGKSYGAQVTVRLNKVT